MILSGELGQKSFLLTLNKPAVCRSETRTVYLICITTFKSTFYLNKNYDYNNATRIMIIKKKSKLISIIN